MPPKIRKPWVDWETFNQITGFTWTPGAHTHVVADITDFAVGAVEAAANITDHAIVRGDGGAKGIQASTSIINDAGNIGIGHSDIEAWHADYQVLEFPHIGIMSLKAATGNYYLLVNAYYDGSWKYKSAGAACAYSQSTADVTWRYVAPGAEDAILAWTERMRIELDTGNVGIGTATPDRILDIYHATTPRVKLDSPAAAEPGYELYNAGVLSSMIYRPANTDDMRFYLGGARMTILSGGNVGIGTVSPGVTLDCVGKFRITTGSAEAPASGEGLEIYHHAGNNLSTLLAYDRSGSAYMGLRLSGDYLRFDTTGTERIRILAGGNVGINVADPDEKLEVNGNVKADTFLLAAGITPTLSWLSDVNMAVELNGQIISHWDGEWLNRWGYEVDLPPIAYKLVTEFVGYTNEASPPWVGLAIGGGTMTGIPGTANHPGIVQFSSAATINHGYRFLTEIDAFLITGGEVSEFVFQLKRLATTRVKMGFIDTFGWTDPTDGVWLDIRYVNPDGGIFTGKTANNTAISTTGTDFQLVVNTWYRARLQVNSDADEVIYTLYSMDGVVLWTNTLATNIPTGAGRTCGHGIVATHDAAQAFALIWVDFMTAVSIGTLQRGN